MMEVTKQNLLDLINQIGEKIDGLNNKLTQQEKFIEELREENHKLKSDNQSTLDQVKVYVEELEKIRDHYVNSINKSGTEEL